MACDAMHIPSLKFPRNEIIEVSVLGFPISGEKVLTINEIIPASYQNEAKRIHIPDLAPEMIPGSPEDIRIPVPPSGTLSPMSGLGTPAEPANPIPKTTDRVHPLSKD